MGREQKKHQHPLLLVLLSPHFSRGQNAENPVSSLFAPRKRLAIKTQAIKTPALRFRVDRKHFENESFWKRWRDDNHVTSLTEFSSNTNPK